MWSDLRYRLRSLFRRRAVEQELDAELRAHLDHQVESYTSAGLEPNEARRRAHLAFGGLDQAKEECRDARGTSWIDMTWQDVRYAFRGLRRSPAFSAVAIVTLALGIGANAAMFSIADAAMFKPLPYRHPDQLVNIAAVYNAGTAEETHQIGLNWKELDQWRAERQIFSQVVTYGNPRPADVPEIAATGPITVGSVSPELLECFGIRPRLGRWLTADDARLARPVVLLSEAAWRNAFSADPRILGRTITIDRVPHTVVGVMPQTFSWGVASGGAAATVAWRPFDEETERRKPGAGFVNTTFRIRDGLSLSDAQHAAEAAVAHMAQASTGAAVGVELLPLDSRQRFQSTTRTALAVLLGVVGCVLLIACANVANLLLARAVTRRRELAVRAALGASRGRLVRQMLTEGVVLTSLGGTGGLMIAAVAVANVPALVPAQLGLFSANPLTLDVRVLTVCAAAVVVTALLCSLIPALRSSRADLLGALEGSSKVAGANLAGRRLRHVTQAVEVALTLVLLAGVALLASSFVKMLWTPPGFEIDGLATATVSLPRPRYPTPAAQREFFDTLLARVGRLPGVRAATYGPPPPAGSGGRFIPFGHEHDATTGAPSLSLYYVDADYFRVAGIPVKEGRLFDNATGPGSTPVAIIDENAARRYWPGQSAIGQQFRYSPFVPWITVVGVAGHVKTRAFAGDGGTVQAYLPSAQNSSTSFGVLLMRADGDAHAVLNGAQAIVHALDATIDLQQARVVADMYDDVFVAPRFYLVLMSIFAVLALTTAAVGLFGLLNYSVSQRTREIGVRLALGASVGKIRALVMRDAFGPVAAGVVAGLAAAFWLTRYLGSLLYGVTPHDGVAYVAATAVLLVVAGIAVLQPARRATRVDPVTTLRVE